MENNKMLAMILAGGRGTRLYDLTNKYRKTCCLFWWKISHYRLPSIQLRKL